MKISAFQSGKFVQRNRYKSFEPVFVNTLWELDDSQLIMLLSEANIKLGELNAFSQLIPDVDFFIKMHVRKEATKSSRIEGTQTNIDEAIQKVENLQPEKKDDWQEVQNYVQAMNEAILNLQTLPISTRLLTNTHKILLQAVEENTKCPASIEEAKTG